MQIFILLSGIRAFISNAIYGGGRSFNQPSTTSRLIFIHSLLPPPPTTTLPSPPLSKLPISPVNPDTSPSPPLRDVGSIHITSASSEASVSPSPSPFQRDVGGFTVVRQRIRGGGKTRGPMKCGRPGGELRNTSHDICHGSFSPIPASFMLTISHPNDAVPAHLQCERQRQCQRRPYQRQRQQQQHERRRQQLERWRQHRRRSTTASPASARAANIRAWEFHLRRERGIEVRLRVWAQGDIWTIPTPPEALPPQRERRTRIIPTPPEAPAPAPKRERRTRRRSRDVGGSYSLDEGN